MIRPPTIRLLTIAGVLGGCVTTARNAGQGTRVTEAGWASAPVKPSASPSDEATQDQLLLAREQGQAVDAAVAWLAGHGGVASATMGAGEYQVTCLLRPTEGTWTQTAGGLQWRRDAGNALVAVIVQDGADRRLVPGLDVSLHVWDGAGAPVAATPLPYRWGVPVEAYAAGVSLPAGPLRIRIDIQPPGYWRHDPLNGDRFAKATLAEFTGLRFDPGQQPGPPGDPGTALALAKAQGAALARAYAEMSRGVANQGTETIVGEYRVAYAVEYAETFWRMSEGDLVYDARPEQSAETNAHVEVAVFDALTGRFLPGLSVHVSVVDAAGRPAGTEAVPFMWHPWLHHYGRNWRVPRAGDYRLRIHVDPPIWARADRELGRRFVEPIDVVFDAVHVFTGQK